MHHISKWKVTLACLVCLLSFIFTLPNFLNSNLPDWVPLPRATMHLGLDLQGGSHLLLQVDFDAYLHEQFELMVDNVRKELRKAKIGYIGLKSEKKAIEFSVREKIELKTLLKIMRNVDPSLDVVSHDGVKYYITFRHEQVKALEQKILGQSIEVIRMRVDETGTKEPSIQRQGSTNILLQVPGYNDPDHLKRLLGQTAKLTFHLLDDSMTSTVLKAGTQIMLGHRGEQYVVKKKVLMTGDMLTDASAGFSDKHVPVVNLRFNNAGTKKFADITKSNAGKYLAIVIDNKVITAAQINEPITGGKAQISGNYTVESANDMALLLRAGALPAPITILEQRTVGPNLGADSIKAGKVAALCGVVMVMSFMMLTYGILGLFANIALIINLMLIVSILSVLQATLTMPGIAGIVLTMGMAVDANVLIFERIREEQRSKMSPHASIIRGFQHAFSTIIDSNLTTVIVALFLYIFGTGVVKGFAVTLTIGILSSMFSAITLTRLMIEGWYNLRRPKRINL